MPARLIIDTDGVIRYAEINPDYTVRPDPEETVAALKEIV
jgi:peroxiredoxin